MGRRRLAGSAIGGIAETQEMLDFCGKHNVTADVEVIPIQKVNEAYERLLKSDVKYRFAIDMSLGLQRKRTSMRAIDCAHRFTATIGMGSCETRSQTALQTW